MSVADLGKVYVFSGISGTILKEGKPVVGAKLTRTAGFSSEQTDSTVTDEKGYFSLPAMTEKSVKKYLPQEFVAKQNIYVDVDGDGEAVHIWAGVKRKFEEYAESKGEPLIVTCEITKEKYLKQVDGSPIISRCDWDAEPDNLDTGF